VALKATVEYHWLLGAACLRSASVRNGAAGGALSLPLGCSITVAAPSFSGAAGCAQVVPMAPVAQAATHKICLIRFIDRLPTGQADPADLYY
jgi:hypothetical protein